MNGFLLIDKPVGPTSHDIVDDVRKITGERRVGHAGTLDPFASGLLIVGVGREATREMQKLVGLDKTYETVFMLGAKSDTDDKTGKITFVPPKGPLTQERVQETLKKFVGEIEQTPPTYSAIKIGGKKMYEAAREGKPMEGKARRVKIYSIENIVIARSEATTSPTKLQRSGKQSNDSSSRANDSESRDLSTLPPMAGSVEMTDEKFLEIPPPYHSITLSLSFTISCSSGTYIRAIARDLGQALGTGGYVESLRRTKIGPFNISECDESIIPISAVLSRLCHVRSPEQSLD